MKQSQFSTDASVRLTYANKIMAEKSGIVVLNGCGVRLSLKSDERSLCLHFHGQKLQPEEHYTERQEEIFV